MSREVRNRRRRRRTAPRARIKFLVDHNVQEGLGQLDDREVAAYAAAESLIVVTHDGAFYNRLLHSSQQAILLRVQESHARQRLRETLPAVISALRKGRCAVRVMQADIVVDRFEKTR